MGLMDKFKDLMGLPSDNDLEDDFEDNEPEDGDNVEHLFDSGAARRSNRLINIPATTQLQVVIVKPERFEDARDIADHLNEKHTVVLNLEASNRDVARRLIDFLSGVAYANKGQIKKIANSTYMITPFNVDIMGELMDELENSGVVF